MKATGSTATLAIALLVLAGCMQSAPPSADTHASRSDVAAAPLFSAFLCKEGVRLAADLTEGRDDCNHRVTKPLLDNRTFDWRSQHGPANEVSVAVDPTNPLRVAGGAKDYTVSYLNGMAPGGCGAYTVWMGVYWSTDGGVSWENELMPGFPGDDRASPLTGNDCNTDPVAIFAQDGTFHFSGLNYGGQRPGSPSGGIPPNPLYPGSGDVATASQVYFATSHDGGATFPNEGFGFCALGDDGLQFHDKQWFAVHPDGRHLIATWTPFYSTPPFPDPSLDPTAGLLSQYASYISYCESNDGGRTWSPQRLFHPGAGSPVNAQFSMPAYLPSGRNMDLAVIWAEDSDISLPRVPIGSGEVRLSYTEGRITPQGTVFQPVLSTFPMDPLKSGPGRDGTGPSTFRVSTYPVLAIDTSGGPHNGRRYVVWANQEGPLDSDTQVLLRHSDDGRSWSQARPVNDVAQGDQFMPWVDVDPYGGVHVAWMDRRHDAANRLLDVYYAYSEPGGEAFSNLRVTEASFDGDRGHHQGGFPFIGDYIGLDATAHSAVIMWSDTRHTGSSGRAAGSDVYSATIVRDAAAYDLFAARQALSRQS